jgi:post-segregation antitoxin (ccd killing protein)
MPGRSHDPHAGNPHPRPGRGRHLAAHDLLSQTAPAPSSGRDDGQVQFGKNVGHVVSPAPSETHRGGYGRPGTALSHQRQESVRRERDGAHYAAPDGGSVRTIMHTVPKSRITVTVDRELVSQARSLGVSLSAACERGLAEVTEIASARAELTRQVAEFEANGGVYDDQKLARARQILAEVDASDQLEPING